MTRNPVKHIQPFLVLILVMSAIHDVKGHGGLVEPPMRSVAWKYGFDTPVNYDWMGLYCGGLGVFQKNGGKCGLCGDPYTGPIENDQGGIYDTGTIVRHYPAGLQEIEVKVELTAHHKGHFQFKLCPNNEHPLTQSCLDRYPLMIREARAQGDPYTYYPPKEPKLNELHILLPPDVTCDRCVLQWTYTAGNNAGQGEDGRSCVGCGIQETFVNCADISIGGTVDRIPVANASPNDGSVVVLEQQHDLTEIINSSSTDSFNDILHAFRNTSELVGTRISFGNDPRHFSPNEGGVIRGEPSGLENRNPRVFVQPAHMSAPSTSLDMVRNSANVDALGFVGERAGHRDLVSPTDVHRLAAIRASEALRNQQRFWQEQNNPTFMQSQEHHLTDQGHNFPNQRQQIREHFTPQTDNRLMSFGIPPPSQVSTQLTFENNHHVIGDGARSQDALLGSVSNMVGNIWANRANTVDNRRPGQISMQPSREFVEQMNHLRHSFPNTQEWRRGDGMTSSNHAVRHAPHLDTHDFSTAEIHSQVPSLPRDIGPRQDVSPFADPRVHPNMFLHQQNWFPASQATERPSMRLQGQENSVLPRRIEVHSMAIAQHLLRKYPQLRGRVYLSREAHLRNTFAHMIHKYAMRQNWHL